MTELSPSVAKPLVTLGIRLKRVRERSGKSLREVARELGVSASFLSQMERGKSQPSVATLYSLSQLLGVSIDELFAEEDDGDTAGERAAAAAPEPVATPPVNRSDLGSLADAWPHERKLPMLSVTRPGERHVLEMDSGVIWERLVDNTGTGLDFIEIIYPPHSSSTNDQRMLRHSGFEFGWLIEGELEVTVGFEVLTLRAGEAIGFDSAVPHLLANRTDATVRGIWCVRHGY
ncbi:helix-turn-helix domain-containing protein [Paractinoplanes globisporus]|uniref:Helix-turn-helix domain-containing protein n=1 Tax=Paractinoplanes globisporus TaxID=113565 RepID=A0ABW6WCJ9_9ACTN|nr:helix-turn-helix domain-containing protein [Actinoplanes globisporus]